MCTAAWAPSTSTGMPRACAMRTTSLIGTTVPSTFDMCVMATIRVRWREQAFELVEQELAESGDRRPFEHAALALAVEMPGHDVGMVLHDGEHDLVALA